MTISPFIRRCFLLVLLVIVATAGRLFTNYLHLWNFAPIGAVGLFGGAILKNKKIAVLLLLATLLCSDICLELFTPIKGFYGWSQLLNYAAFICIVMLGTAIRRISLRNIVFASLASSLIFFFLSNFGVWLFSGGIIPYTHDLNGLLSTYVLAIPFFGNTIAGDLCYCSLLFGAYSFYRRMSFRKSAAIA
jgi:hypothetical protein